MWQLSMEFHETYFPMTFLVSAQQRNNQTRSFQLERKFTTILITLQEINTKT